MPDTYRIRISVEAGRHLQEIFDYIAKDSPQNAAGMIRRIFKSIDNLDILPHRYKVVQNSGVVGEEIRSMVVRPYLVRYQVDDGGSSRGDCLSPARRA